MTAARRTRRAPGPLIRWSAAVAVAFALAGCGRSSSHATSTTGERSAAPPATVAPSVGGGAMASAAPGLEPAATSNPAASLQSAFEQAVVTAGPSVVLIETPEGLGSGIVLDTKGHIVTNAHVVGGARQFRVTLANGEVRSATLVASYPPNDLAVIDATGSGFRAATFGDSGRLRVGDIVLAMGNPLGLRSSVTQGIVSALGRTVTEPGGAALPNAIQTSASINPGNSGGALVDLAGRVVGIPTLAATDPQMGGAAPGIGFAIAGNTVRDLADQMVARGRVVNSHRAFLGVGLASGATGEQGAVVADVRPGAPAAKAGIRAGDQILAIAGQPTPDAGTVASVLANQNPGDRVDVEVRHADGSRTTLHITLGELPA